MRIPWRYLADSEKTMDFVEIIYRLVAYYLYAYCVKKLIEHRDKSNFC
jgi:hypothetical protein